MKTLRNLVTLVLAVLLTSLSAHAQIIETDQSTEGSGTSFETTYDTNIQSNDLLTGATITTNGVAPDYGSSYSGLNDGLATNGGGNAPNNLFLNHNVTGTPALDGNPVVTFTLNTSGSPLGYNLTSINSIYGWQNFASFSDQNYTVSYSTVADPTDFILLATVSYTPFNPDDPNNGDNNASQVTLTNLTGAVGVGALQFSFTPYVFSVGGEQSGQMIREIDVDGTPTLAAPEPGTWVLMLGGLGFLASYRRFHKVAAKRS